MTKDHAKELIEVIANDEQLRREMARVLFSDREVLMMLGQGLIELNEDGFKMPLR